MNNNKSPGSDGFSTEFFKFFWINLKSFVVNSINVGSLLDELSVTQKQGIITCLPKDNKPRHFLKNWRQISLLNTVYKIGFFNTDKRKSQDIESNAFSKSIKSTKPGMSFSSVNYSI
jgi:hypothetical protein